MPTQSRRHQVPKFIQSDLLFSTRVQYSPTFRPQCWWIRFHSKEDRQKAMSIRDPRWGGRRVWFEEKGITDWEDGTFNHLVGNSLGSAILITRLPFQTTDEDVASFFRNFHLQGNGVTLIQDVSFLQIISLTLFSHFFCL